MSEINTKQKIILGETLGEWYRQFGKVAPRRPYHDDEGGGAGTASLNPFESHPLLEQIPPGAPSDLTYILNDNKQALDEAEKREDQACPELKKQLENVLALRHGKHFMPEYKPT